MKHKNAKGPVLVYITAPEEARRLLQAGIQEASLLQVSLQVLYTISNFPGPDTITENQIADSCTFIEELRQKSAAAGAELTILFRGGTEAVAGFAARTNTQKIVLAVSEKPVSQKVNMLRNLLPHVSLSMVTESSITYRMLPSEKPSFAGKF